MSFGDGIGSWSHPQIVALQLAWLHYATLVQLVSSVKDGWIKKHWDKKQLWKQQPEMVCFFVGPTFHSTNHLKSQSPAVDCEHRASSRGLRVRARHCSPLSKTYGFHPQDPGVLPDTTVLPPQNSMRDQGKNKNWLVVYLPLWKIWKSLGIIIPNIWENQFHVPNQPENIQKTHVIPSHSQIIFPCCGVKCSAAVNLLGVCNGRPWHVRKHSNWNMSQGSKPPKRSKQLTIPTVFNNGWLEKSHIHGG